jgi:NTE family protein
LVFSLEPRFQGLCGSQPFLVVDARRGPSGDWAQSPEGPTALDIVRATADTAIDSSALASFTAFDQTMSEWLASLVRWRCSLPATDQQNYGVVPRRDCRDLIFLSVALILNNLAHCAPWR